MLEAIEQFITKLEQGLENGLNACIESVPLLVRQHITSIVTRRLDSTKSEYLNALSSGYESGLIYVVELKEENVLAHMLEQGCSSFEMKEGLLRSPKAKVSKQGNRYIHIPIPQNKTGRDAKTLTGQELQTKIRKALERPVFSSEKSSVRPDGTVSVMEKVASRDPDVQGLYRVRKYATMEAYKGGGRPHSSQFVLFRTASEKPDAKGKWVHPGLRPLNAFPQTQQWCDTVLPEVLASIFEQAIEKSLSSQ